MRAGGALKKSISNKNDYQKVSLTTDVLKYRRIREVLKDKEIEGNIGAVGPCSHNVFPLVRQDYRKKPTEVISSLDLKNCLFEILLRHWFRGPLRNASRTPG